jgi:hypothetical protein
VGKELQVEQMSLKFDFETFCDHAAHGRLADVQRMLESGELPVNGKAHVALLRAAQNGHVDVVDCLLRHAVSVFDPSTDSNRAIWLAAGNGHLAVVERLLRDERVDPSANDSYAVQWAAARGHHAVVDRLLRDARVNPSSNDNYAVRLASQFGHLAVVDRLLQDARVDPSANENFAVRWAVWSSHLAVVERLLEDDRVDVAVAIQCSRSENLKRFECRERLTEICIALQDLELPAWVTVQILDAARPWSTLPLHSKWDLVCTIKHFRDKQP